MNAMPLDPQVLVLDVPRTNASFSARTFSYVDASGDCWQWTGATNGFGYGVINRGGRKGGRMVAHRAVWELLVGPIPDGLFFDHLCRNHGCVNPDHGELVTHAENTQRGYGLTALYGKRATCSYGHALDGNRGARGGQGKRYCKTCNRDRNRANRAVRAESEAA